MSTVNHLSRVLLVIEALILLLPSLFGLMMFFGCFASLFIGNTEEPLIFRLFCMLAFFSFYSLWHIYFDVITREFERGKKLNRTICLFAFLGFVLAIAAIILNELEIKTGIEMFGFGILYVPTYLHLLYEIKRQTGTVY
jgi:hypothetical protein